MAMSVFDHINQLWHEFLRDASFALFYSYDFGTNRSLDCPMPGSDITAYMTLHAILEDSFVYGRFLRDKDIIMRRGDSFRIFSPVVSGLYVLFGFNSGLHRDLNVLCRYTKPCGDVGELSDGLMRVMSAVCTKITSMNPGLDKIEVAVDAFLSLFTLSFLIGFFFDDFFTSNRGCGVDWEGLQSVVDAKEFETEGAS